MNHLVSKIENLCLELNNKTRRNREHNQHSQARLKSQRMFVLQDTLHVPSCKMRNKETRDDLAENQTLSLETVNGSLREGEYYRFMSEWSKIRTSTLTLISERTEQGVDRPERAASARFTISTIYTVQLFARMWKSAQCIRDLQSVPHHRSALVKNCWLQIVPITPMLLTRYFTAETQQGVEIKSPYTPISREVRPLIT